MPNLFKRIRLAFVGSPVFKYLFLVVAPLFAKPVDFVQRVDIVRPRYARYRFFYGLPLLPAGLYASSSTGLLQWMALREQAVSRMPQEAINPFLSSLSYVSWITTASIFVAIYLIAGYRWLINKALVRVINHRDEIGFVPPFVFFLVGTSSFALWFALFGWVVFALMRRYGPGLEPVFDTFASSHPYLFFAALAASGLVLKAAQENEREGMLSMYGDSPLLMNVAAAIKLGFTIALFWGGMAVVSWISRHV